MGVYPERQIEQVEQDKQIEQVVLNETTETSCSTETIYTDTDTETDTETDTDTDTDNDIENENETVTEMKETSTKLMTILPNEERKIHKDFDTISIALEAMAAENEDFPYSEELVERFYAVNEERGWLDGEGEEITDIFKWYLGFCYSKLPNGYTTEIVYLM